MSVNKAKEVRAVAALMTEPSYTAAAEKAGITRDTLRRWLKKPGFQNLYRQARNEAVSLATTQLRRDMTLAAHTLAEIVGDKKAQAMARVVAAQTILNYAMRAAENDELAARMDELEQQLTKAAHKNAI
jgi:ATP/maltotriose-dependent transcriptional regulator MalT